MKYMWIAAVASLLAIAALTVLPLRTAEAFAPPICPHANEWTDGVNAWADGAPWIKVLYASNIPRAKDKGARVLYRPWDQRSGPDGDTKVGGVRMGNEVLDNLKRIPKDKWPDAISFQNEFNNVSPETAKAFMDYYDTLRSGGYDGLIVYGSYGPGGPTDKTEWERPHIRAAVEKADAIETHEYWDLTIKWYDTWLAHRHVRAMDMYPWLKGKPWFIGEFGSDRVNQVEDKELRSGWQDRGKLTADAFIKQIEIYRHGDPSQEIPPCAKNVMAVFLYQQGAPNWEKFEVLGTKVADYMKSTWKPTVGYVKGKVKDAGGKPVERVTVTASPGGEKALTDSKGRYWLFALQPGKYTVKATKAGFKADSKTIELAAGDIATVDFTP